MYKPIILKSFITEVTFSAERNYSLWNSSYFALEKPIQVILQKRTDIPSASIGIETSADRLSASPTERRRSEWAASWLRVGEAAGPRDNLWRPLFLASGG